MPKRIVEDVIPPERRSIRNIPLPESRGSSYENNAPVQPISRATREAVRRAPVSDDIQIKPPVQNRQAPVVTPKKQKEKKSKKKFVWFFVILLIVLALGVVVSSFFKNATVTVTPKQQTLPVNITVTANTEAGKADLLYQTITLTKEKSVEVAATGEEDVQKKASGSIIVFNNLSESQVLVKNTRFRTPSGLIFRIQDQITVPGKKGTTPGSIKTIVYADEAGEKYNIGLQDFVIPGFESDPARFKAVTAKSDPSSPLQGGFIGKVKKVSDADKALANQTLESDLKKEITESVAAQIPEGYMSINSGANIKFEDLPLVAGSSSNTAKIGKRATAQVIIVNSDELEQQIIKVTSGDAENGPGSMRIKNLGNLPLTVDSTTSSTDSTIRLQIRGDLNFISKIDTDSLANNLAGKSRSAMKTILSNYDTIEKAEAVVRPVWSTSFPNNPKKVYIEVLEP